jgi:hypothetical protein
VNIRFLIALAAILFSALPSLANWDNRFWPASEKPARVGSGTNRIFQANVITSNIAAAVRERFEAVAGEEIIYVEEDILAYGERFQERGLVEAKQFIKQTLTGFLDQTRFPSPNSPSSAQITNLVYWSVSNILVHCNLPTNFFDYTPPRNLAAHPGITSTNIDYTQYGWDATRKVITNLIYTYEPKGAMINQTVDVSKISFYLGDAQYTKPNGNCSDQSGEPDEPIAFGELTLANYTAGTAYFKSASRRQVLVPDPNPPKVVNWFDQGLFTTAFLNSESSFGVNGILAARLGTSGIASNSGHIAFTFEKESGDGPESCRFPTNSANWEFSGTIAGLQKSADNNYFITGGIVGFDAPSCEFWSENVMGDFFGYGFDAGDLTCIGCLGYDGCYPSNINVLNGNPSLGSSREYAHIIQWNFRYK